MKNNCSLFSSNQNTKLFLFLLLISFSMLIDINASAQDCAITTNYFETLGGSSTDQTVTGQNSCKTMIMDTKFEVITLQLGSIPEADADFNMVNYDAEPGEGEVSIKYYAYAGNEVETLNLQDAGKTAHVCVKDGKVTVSWKGVKFHQIVNGDMLLTTSCEMTCK